VTIRDKSGLTIIWATNYPGDNLLGDIFRLTGRHNFDYFGESAGNVYRPTYRILRPVFQKPGGLFVRSFKVSDHYLSRLS